VISHHSTRPLIEYITLLNGPCVTSFVEVTYKLQPRTAFPFLTHTRTRTHTRGGSGLRGCCMNRLCRHGLNSGVDPKVISHHSTRPLIEYTAHIWMDHV
jgi:hypothetical protein